MKISTHLIRTCLLASIIASPVCAMKTLEDGGSSASSSSTARQTFNAEKYSVARGEKVRHHQQMLESKYASIVRRAFEKAGDLNGVLPLGWKVVDFGCGLGLTRGTIGKIIGETGLYTGVDICEEDIRVARADSPNVSFILGDQNTLEVQEVLGQADVVFMRLVTMHQQSGAHETFLGEIFKHLKPGGILIDLEPAGTPEQEAFLTGKSPLFKIIFDLKRTREAQNGVKYDVALEEKALLGKLTAIPVMEISEDNVVSAAEGAAGVKRLLSAVSNAAIQSGAITLDQMNELTNTLDVLAQTPNFYFHNGKTFAFIAKKPVVIPPAFVSPAQ